jgi:hypothetical protein
LAVRYLCEEFFPRIGTSLRSDFEFVVAGRNPTDEVQNLLKKCKIKLLKDLTNEQMRKLISDTYITSSAIWWKWIKTKDC